MNIHIEHTHGLVFLVLLMIDGIIIASLLSILLLEHAAILDIFCTARGYYYIMEMRKLGSTRACSSPISTPKASTIIRSLSNEHSHTHGLGFLVLLMIDGINIASALPNGGDAIIIIVHTGSAFEWAWFKNYIVVGYIVLREIDR
jgi:hypothetical protein